MLPSLAFRNLAHLRSGDAVLRGHPLLYASRAVLDGKENLHGFGICEFGGDASFAALCRAVLEHVALIVPVGIPSKVLDAIIQSIAIVMTDISLPRKRRTKKRLRHKLMGGSSVRLLVAVLAEDECSIAVTHRAC